MATFHLQPVPPFRLDLTVWVLRRLPINQIDCWDRGTYRRTLTIDDVPIEVAIVQTPSQAGSELTVTTRGGRLISARREKLAATLNKMLGLNVDLRPVYELAKREKRLAGLIEPFLGFKPPRLPTGFETLINAVACQQLSLTVGIHLLNRLCSTYGLAVGEHRAFPRPGDFASATPEGLRRLGFSGRKAQTILNIARAIVGGRLDLEGLSTLDDAEALHRLMELKGIGRWTAQYILLRGLGRLDVFPADDVGGQNKMQKWLGYKDRPDYDEINRIIAPWRPYRGLIYFYLLLNHQHHLGLFDQPIVNASSKFR